MTAQLLEFSLKHIGLVSAIVATLCALGLIEYLQWGLGSLAVSPTRATLLINHHDAQVLDLREGSEFLKGHLPQATHMDQPSKAIILQKIQVKRPIIFVTAQSMPPLHLLRQFKAVGCSELYHLKGGILAWEAAHLPLIRPLSEI